MFSFEHQSFEIKFCMPLKPLIKELWKPKKALKPPSVQPAVEQFTKTQQWAKLLEEGYSS